MINEFVLGTAIMFVVGLVFGKIAKKLRIPNVTGYIIGGLLIGPVLFALIIPGFKGVIGWDLVTALKVVTDIELGFIAFTVGSEFKLSYFKKVGLMPLYIAIGESLAAVVFITCGMLLFGVPLYFALCMGAVGGATAPAATIMVVRQYKAKGDLSQTLLSVVAIDDATALVFFGVAIAIVKALINPGAEIGMTILMPFVEILGSAGLGIVTGILLTVFIRYFRSNGNRLVLTVATIFVNIGICALVNSLIKTAFSPLLASILTGMVFTNYSKVVDDVMPLIEGITPPIVVLFFMLAGAGLEVEALTGLAVLLVMVYLVFRVAGKFFGTWLSAKGAKAPPVVQKWLGFGLLPQGGIAIGLSMLIMQVLSSVPEENLVAGYNGQLIRVIVLCAVFLSELFGPILCKMAIIKSGEGQDNSPVKKVSRRLATVPQQISADNEGGASAVDSGVSQEAVAKPQIDGETVAAETVQAETAEIEKDQPDVQNDTNQE